MGWKRAHTMEKPGYHWRGQLGEWWRYRFLVSRIVKTPETVSSRCSEGVLSGLRHRPTAPLLPVVHHLSALGKEIASPVSPLDT